MVSYHELGLKGRNRARFEHRLMRNINFALKEFNGVPCERFARRIIVDLPHGCDERAIGERIAALAGVAHTALAYRIGRSFDEICSVALTAYQEAGGQGSFRVSAKRSNTDFPLTSLELNRDIGAYIIENTGAPVDLHNPAINVRVLVVGGTTFIYAALIPGVGGLPAGSSQPVVSLLSSGIDSPVATWRILRRGAIGIGVHFSGRPATSSSSEHLVKEIGDVLSRTGGLARIYIVPFGDIQRHIASIVMPDLRIIMYRRLMFEVAQAVARQEDALALVTGESLGQVASQTLENIRAVDEVATLPVLRPLIGNDKLEIIADARAIGTFDISTQDADDCCTLFMPRKPETHARLSDVHCNWEELDVESLVQQCITTWEILEFPCIAYKPAKKDHQRKDSHA